MAFPEDLPKVPGKVKGSKGAKTLLPPSTETETPVEIAPTMTSGKTYSLNLSKPNPAPALLPKEDAAPRAVEEEEAKAEE